MAKQSNREQLIEWMREIVPYNNLEKYVREEPREDPGRFGFIICTAEHTFSISGHEQEEKRPCGYLGCIMYCRRSRAGETHLRGADLPDGAFNRETWDHIKTAIARVELVKLDPVSVPMGIKEGSSEPWPALEMFRHDTFYGPHSCECGAMIVRQDLLRGGVKFDSLGMGPDAYPSNRPDLPWKLHECKPSPVGVKASDIPMESTKAATA